MQTEHRSRSFRKEGNDDALLETFNNRAARGQSVGRVSWNLEPILEQTHWFDQFSFGINRRSENAVGTFLRETFEGHVSLSLVILVTS